MLAGCGSQKTASKKATHTAALVTDGGGIDDKSFNQSAWEGLEKWGASHDLKKKGSMVTITHNRVLMRTFSRTLIS